MSLAHVDVVLVRPRQSGNIGAVARAIANHGLGRRIQVAPPAFDPDRARWMAPGAHDVINRALFARTVAEAVGDHTDVVATSARRRKWNWPHVSTSELADVALAQRGRLAVLFGPEDSGLTNEDLALARSVLVLPTSPHASLNLSQAVVVVAAQLLARARAAGEGPAGPNRQRPRRGGGRTGQPPPREVPAPVAEVMSVVDESMPLIDDTTYLRGRSPEQVQGTLYRLLQRATPSRRELNILRGMLAKFAWRMGRGS